MAVAQRRRLEPQARRQEIIEAAERLLKTRGSAVRVEDVVREAGAAKGTFYLYFATWDDLLETLRARIFAEFDAAHPPPNETDSAVDWLRWLERLADAFIDFTVAKGGLHDALFHSDFAQRRPLPPGEDAIGRLAGIIRAGQRAGTFAAAEAAPLARLLFAVIHETADAVLAGEDRDRALDIMHWVLRRTLTPEPGR